MKTRAYATASATSPLAATTIERRAVGPRDVQLDILFSGICHSDIHQARNEWGGSMYPMVPGHEIVGRITAVGADVTRFAVGDLAGVGCFVDSCRECRNCQEGEEHYCEKHLQMICLWKFSIARKWDLQCRSEIGLRIR